MADSDVADMPLVKTIEEGNVTTEIIDLTDGLGNLSPDEVLARTGGGAGQVTVTQPDGSKVTYFVEEVSFFTLPDSPNSEI